MSAADAPAPRFDVVTFGELVVDLVPVTIPAGTAYLPKPGGAPANVAAGIARLGLRSAMISKVGTEAFGRVALAALAGTGVSTEAIIRTNAHKTALAIVSLTDDGVSDFSFYRENCADANLAIAEIPAALIAASRILHVGTLPLATPISAAAQRHAIACAAKAAIVISTDVNFRTAFWGEGTRMRDAGRDMVTAANIVKVSEEELRILSGEDGIDAGARRIWHDRLQIMAVTRGAAGAVLFTTQEQLVVPAYPVEVVDTIGCGDAFMASLLAGFLADAAIPSGDRLTALARTTAAAGAVMATRSGALESMPTRADIAAMAAGT